MVTTLNNVIIHLAKQWTFITRNNIIATQALKQFSNSTPEIQWHDVKTETPRKRNWKLETLNCSKKNWCNV